MDQPTRAKVIGVGNQKGGVGKTTNTVHTAIALSELGRRVLIWDLDAHAGATRHFGIKPGAYWGTFEVLTGQDEVKNIILAGDEEDITLPENVHLIPAARDLEGLDRALGSDHKFFPAGVLQEPVEWLRSRYDYILLDTGPNASTPTLAAYMAADYFMLSTTPQPLSIQGIEEAVADIQSAIRQGNSKLVLLGVVVSDVEKRFRITKRNVPYLQQLFTADGDAESSCFKTIINRSTVIAQAQDAGTTLFVQSPNHKLTNQYRALAQEIEERLARAQQQAPEPVQERAAVTGQEVING